jgi:vanillate O-demethylase monooxygenase subunit
LLRNTTPALRFGWHPVCRSDALDDDPLAVQLLGEHWVLRRDEDGTPVARTSRDGRTVTAAGTTDHLDRVWISPEPPMAALLPAAEVGDPAFASGWLPAARTRAAAGLILDNQLDVSHFPFVHTTTFGQASDVFVPPYTITRLPGGFTATVEHAFRNVQDPGVLRGDRPVEQVRRVTYTFALPMQLQLRIDHLQTGQRTVILFGFTPQDEGATLFTTHLLRNDLPEDPGDAARRMPELLAFEQQVVEEDLGLQARFDVPGLPLLTGLELPVRADACGLELRRQLREMCAAAALAAP